MAKVLVVDDRALNREYLTTLLSYRDHDVIEACDGADALRLFAMHHPDLVITDLLMPKMDGYEFVQQLRTLEGGSDARVIFYTAHYLVDEVRPFATAAGVSRVLAKPAEPADLLAAVDATLAAVMTHEQDDDRLLEREHTRALSAKLLEKVDELEAARDALEQSESRFRTLADSAPVGITSISADGTVTYANRRLAEIFGRDPDAPASLDRDAIHPDDRAAWSRAVRSAINSHNTFSRRARVVRPDGAVRWADFIVSPVTEPSSDCAFVGTVHDVTVSVENETRLRTSERLESLGQLAAGIAHDFNNILGVVLNYAQFATAGLDAVANDVEHPKLARVRDDLATITRAGQRAADLTNQLLIFGRGDRLSLVPVDLNAVVVETERFLKRTIPTNVRVVATLDTNLGHVLADHGRLSQAIVNLAVNARDAISDSGSVLISTGTVDIAEGEWDDVPGARPGQFAILSVTDDGVGMDASTLARAFEPFFTTKSPGKGTGLGLATVYGVAQELGGFVTLQSAVGFGTTVQLFVPLAGHPAPEEREGGQDTDLVGHGETVLLVDDDDDTRAASKRILDECGYVVVEDSRAADALKTLAARPNDIALVLTDVVMPGMSGRELASRIAQQWPDIPVLLASGYAGEDDGTPVLRKPLLRDELLAAVAGALATRASR